MPLLHQDTSRGGGGSSENRHSLSDFLVSFDALHLPESATAPAVNHRNSDSSESEWRWEEPGSPEAAQTPRGVPEACFPSRHPRAFTSYSESAQPGVTWPEENGPERQNGQAITDLANSLKGLKLPPPSSRLSSSTCSTDGLDKTNMEPPWASESSPTPYEDNVISRRASFCGVSVGCGASASGAARWSGAVPVRAEAGAGAGYSAKLFLGGLPWDITEHALMHALRHFHPIRVEWPGRESVPGSACGAGGDSPRGFAYVTLESERRVRALLAASSRRADNNWYYRLHSRKHHHKDAQVIPWAVSDSNWVLGSSVRLSPGRTVFVGALHGMLSASALAHIMNDLFGGVVYAGIDTDKNKYPIGSGRVTFNNVRSYVRAISAGHVEIETDKFTKKIQVDPYLEDSMCSMCNLHQGPYFCREPVCFSYFCRSCWSWRHRGGAQQHRYLMRVSKAAHAHSAHSPSPDAHNHAHQLNGNCAGASGVSNGVVPPEPV